MLPSQKYIRNLKRAIKATESYLQTGKLETDEDYPTWSLWIPDAVNELRKYNRKHGIKFTTVERKRIRKLPEMMEDAF